MLNTIPTRKTFNDAIKSLSPEQQRFCEAIRSMQLASTLFGVLVIQIKPALEKVLNLPDNSLTKEIKLSRNVTEMFTKWQIPSSLLSYGPSNAHENLSEVQGVKQNVEALEEMIEAEKQKEFLNAKQQTKFLDAHQPKPVFKMDSTQDVIDNQPPSYRSLSVSFGNEEFVDVPFQHSPETQHCASEEVRLDSSKKTLYEHPEQGSDDDITTLPGELDRLCAEHNSTRKQTIIETGEQWSLTHQTGLLGPRSKTTIPKDVQREKTQEAFSLIDALTLSGENPITGATLHIVVVSAQSVGENLIAEVVRENCNPIKQAERDDELIASVIHRKTPEEICNPIQQAERDDELLA